MTPFMGLTLPTVGITVGPLWATEINAALTVVDAHNHTLGQGVPVPTAGISINADLPLNSFNLTLIRALQMNNNPSPLSTPADIVTLYGSGGNLWYNNAIGQQVQITAGAGLNAASVGGFGGDYGTSTASAFYTSITSTFTFWQSPNVSALMDVGATTIHPSNSSVNGVTLVAPTGLSSSYNLIFPTSLPVSTSFLTVGASGVIGDTIAPDNSTIQFSGTSLQVVPGGIGSTQIAPGGVAWTNRAVRPGGSSTEGLGGVAAATVSGNVVNGGPAVIGNTVTITTNGGLVMLQLMTVGGGAGTFTFGETNNGAMIIQISNQTNSTTPATTEISWNSATSPNPLRLPAALAGIEAVAPGTYTYAVTAFLSGTFFTQSSIDNCLLVAYEIG